LTRAVSIRDKEGKVLKWFGTTTDIHDMKVAESELIERTKQLEEANKELESFSYSVSHDLRAPLRAINGFSRMLLDEGERFDDETNRRIQVIRENALKMDRLISDLLHFSRSGRTQISRVIIDMDRLVNEIWKEQLSLNPNRNMELRKGGLPPAFGDEAMVRQVLANIISNAVKFSSRKRTSVIEVEAESGRKENIYCVKDNGAGFDMKYYSKLFGVFQRLHSEREYEGTGVGLAIVQRIVHRHGGRVWAEGKIGKGATFYFSLPNKLT
jgi:light-regulated signal transduction histidine kinase (bacteriophytochrome)